MRDGDSGDDVIGGSGWDYVGGLVGHQFSGHTVQKIVSGIGRPPALKWGKMLNKVIG